MANITLDGISETFNHRKPSFVGKHKSYSVLMPIIEMDNDVFFLFEIRSADLKTQPGEICFPGGRIEEGETPMQAAIRETMEELGIPRKDISIISKAAMLQTHANKLMHSYLGRIKTDNIDINEDEVEEVFLVPISFFMENEPDVEEAKVIQKVGEDFPYERINFPKGEYNWASGKNDIPIYEYEDKVIWGLTGRLVHDFVKVMKGEIK